VPRLADALIADAAIAAPAVESATRILPGEAFGPA
jgi:hypothetical protein